MKVLLTGANGQLGWELQRTVPPGIELVAFGSGELDITDQQSVAKEVVAHAPDVIINAAAYTAVDKAEDDSERALLVNGQGAANLAQAAQEGGRRLIHISTDFIFDGRQSCPYLPADLPNPLGIYGKSKLLGEERILAITKGTNTTIIRTAWVYSSHGHNFVKTMLRLMRERDSLAVIADQIGTPTWANGLAQAVWSVLQKGIHGVHHWTDAGVASWYDFAVAIMEEATRLGLLHNQPTIRPIPASAYPLPAQRPPYSVLDKGSLWQALDWAPSHWRVELRKMLREMK
jgi:dTDP-4-dehydrorhamnose reductase